MFDRRKKVPLHRQVKNFIWPSAGWNRSSKYLFHRVARIPGSSYSIAAGFACGAAISFTPFVGLHFILSAALAWLLRANIIASAIGTAVGNPWTFPFIWYWIHSLGNWMGAAVEIKNHAHTNYGGFFSKLFEAAMNLDFTYILDTAWPIFWPMFVGSIPTAIVIWFVFYIPLKYLVSSYKSRHSGARKEDSR